MRTYKDNFSTVRSDIARMVLKSLAGAHLKPGYVERVAAIAAGELNPTPTYSYFATEFKHAGSDCTLHVELENDGYYRDGAMTDADGNEWERYKLHKVTVNWPCHGSCPTGVAIARLRFYENVALLGAMIEAEFSSTEVFRMSATKAQADERRARELAERQLRGMQELVYVHGGRQRVGCKPTYFKASEKLAKAGIPVGFHDVVMTDGKKYTFEVAADLDSCSVKRLN